MKKVIEYILKTPWAIQQEMLNTMIAIAERDNVLDSVQALEAKLGRPLDNTYQMTVRDGVAVLPVQGPLMRYANMFSMISGATSYDLLATDFQTRTLN